MTDMEFKTEKNAFNFRLELEEDFTDAKIFFGDYIRLKKIYVGDIFCLESPDGDFDRVVFIGNGTPYEGISTISHDGWDWKLYNAWRVVGKLRLISGRELLCAKEMKVIAEGTEL